MMITISKFCAPKHTLPKSNGKQRLLSYPTFMSLPCLIIIKWGTAVTELCLLGSKDTNSMWVKMAMGKPIATLIIINQITKLITK